MDKELQNFLTHHKLDIDDFFDAKGKIIKSIYAEMKSKEKLFAYNAVACQNSGHRLRDRHNHCIVCHPANIAFSLRNKKVGFIYIACSLKKEITKVGMTTELIKTRLSKLNSRKVGNTNDWEILYSIKCAKANSVELSLQKELIKYQVKGDFYGDTESKELFRCSYQKAKEIMDEFITHNKVKIIEQKSYVQNKEKYKFRNLRSVNK